MLILIRKSFPFITIWAVATIVEPEILSAAASGPTADDSQIGNVAPPVSELVRVIEPIANRTLSRPSVFAVNIAQFIDAVEGPPPASGAGAFVIPEGAVWPNANREIVLQLHDGGDTMHKNVRRNPWEIRKSATNSTDEPIFLCGGVIIGADDGAVAFLNGRVFRPGDRLGSFSVAGVSPIGVVLRWNNELLVVPRGDQVRVSLMNL